MLPLPRLTPAWVISETEDGAARTAAEFVRRLQARRWRVTSPGSEALSKEHDLAFVDLGAAGPLSGHELSALFEQAGKLDIPLLLTGPASLLADLPVLSDLRPLPVLPERLFQWWGPERADEEMIRNLPPTPITRVTAGQRWAMVETENTVGLAAMPLLASGQASDTPANTGTDYIGAPLRALAERLRMPAGIERSLACAAINAGNLAPDGGSADDGLLPEAGSGTDRTVIVGRFPDLARKRPGAVVLEKYPGPDDLPADAAPYVIPGTDHLVVTSSAWSNGTLAGLLRLASGSRVTLVGPGTPLQPALHAYGIQRLAGFVVADRERTREVIAAGGGVKAFKPHGRQVVLTEE
ncbi:Rossmann-like domain-containing protein [Nisaea sp.]|uniref:Rossmann-like domain-containing protein n=1 Tax=Nisaea sp. TaxID=2024842 RepID=UPI003B52202D